MVEMNPRVNEKRRSESETKPNILLITIDSLRPDHLGAFGYPRETSPNIDKLASLGENYTNAFTHGGGTPQAFPTMLSGVPPPVDIHQTQLGLRRGTSIARVLQNLGYQTAAFNSNPFLSEYFGYADGFNIFYHNLLGAVDNRHTFTGGGIMPYMRLITGKPPCVVGADLVRLALDWTGRVHTPFFAWIHFMDVHMPYLPPSEYVRMIEPNPSNRLYMVWLYRKMYKSNRRVRKSMDPSQSTLTNQDLRKIIEYYDGAIRYVDTCIGALLRGLDRQQLLKDTLVMLTADHGELLGEHGLVDHGYLYDQLLHVPLIVNGPGVPVQKISTPVTHLRIQETIDNLLFAEEPRRQYVSKQEFADFKQGIISSINDANRKSFSCRTEEWHYIEVSDTVLGKTVTELYNLKNDPLETVNVSSHYAELVGRFHGRIAEFVRNNQTLWEVHDQRPLSKNEEEEMNRKLRELGYE